MALDVVIVAGNPPAGAAAVALAFTPSGAAAVTFAFAPAGAAEAVAFDVVIVAVNPPADAAAVAAAFTPAGAAAVPLAFAPAGTAEAVALDVLVVALCCRSLLRVLCLVGHSRPPFLSFATHMRRCRAAYSRSDTRPIRQPTLILSAGRHSGAFGTDRRPGCAAVEVEKPRSQSRFGGHEREELVSSERKQQAVFE